jgi:hypothetical protein
MDHIETKRKANVLFAQRAYAESQRLFEEMISRWPDSKDGYVGLAKVLGAKDNIEELIAAIEPVADRFSSFALFAALANAYRALYLRGDRPSLEPAVRYSERSRTAL